MTPQETKAYIVSRLTVPLKEVSRLIESFNATIDLVTALNTDVIPTWTPLLTFQTDGTDDGKYCKHPDSEGKVRIWETKIDDNTANEPPVDPGTSEDANWKEISPSAAAAIPEWAPGLYGAGLVIVFHNHSADGPGLYVLLEPVRPFTSTNIESEITGGKWEKISGSSGVPSSLQQTITKSSHGFSLKDVITLNSSGVHVKVTDPASNKFVGLVTEVVDANSFRIHTAGYVTGLTGLTAGAIHYAQTDGTLGTTQTDMPVLLADTTTSGYILASGASSSVGAGLRFGTASGTNSYTLTLDPPLTEYSVGLALLVKFQNANTGNATLNVNSLGAKSIVIRSSTQVISGQLDAEKYYLLVYDGTAFQVSDIPYVPNSTTAKGLYVDTTGRVRSLLGSVYTELTRSWVHTGTDDSETTELAKWQNASEETIMRILNGLLVEFGGTTSVWEVLDAIVSGNAGVRFNADQVKAWRYYDKEEDEYLAFQSTSGDKAITIMKPVIDNQGEGFNVRRLHKRIQTSTTGNAWNTIYSIPLDENDTAVAVKVHHLAAFAADGNIAVAYAPANAMGKRISGTVTAVAPTFSMVGDLTTAWRIVANDTNKTIDIQFQNDSTGRLWEVSCVFEFIQLTIPDS